MRPPCPGRVDRYRSGGLRSCRPPTGTGLHPAPMPVSAREGGLASAIDMSPPTNAFGQPIGEALAGWAARPRPPRGGMEGRLCRLEPLDAGRHAAALHEAYSEDARGPQLDLPAVRAVRVGRRVRDLRGVRADARGPAVLRGRRGRFAPARRRGELPAHRSRDGLDRGGAPQLRARTPAPSRSDRGDVPDDAARLRRARLPPLRVEVRRAQRAVAPRGRSASASATRGSSANTS